MPPYKDSLYESQRSQSLYERSHSLYESQRSQSKIKIIPDFK